VSDAVELDGYLVEFRILGFDTDTDELLADIPLSNPDPEYFRMLIGLDGQSELLAAAYPLTADSLQALSEKFGFLLPSTGDRPVMYTLEADRAD
jgi:hypothetical protein